MNMEEKENTIKVKKGNLCSTCKSDLDYSDDFDAYFCPNCNEWAESKCSDPSCSYCATRPDRPLA